MGLTLQHSVLAYKIQIFIFMGRVWFSWEGQGAIMQNTEYIEDVKLVSAK